MKALLELDRGRRVVTADGRVTRPWVARVRLGICRRFLDPESRDYSRANKRGTRGIMDRYILSPGEVYEVCEPGKRNKAVRRFVRVVDGELVEIEREEAIRTCRKED